MKKNMINKQKIKFVYSHKSKSKFVKHLFNKLSKDNFNKLAEYQGCTLQSSYQIKYNENPTLNTFLNVLFATGAKAVVVIYEDEIVKIKA
ncbi:MAG: hypothetical protein NZM44_00905 [Candidatus Calescibacterium sp.]|nr:hypothetical protein [Candidatus Calescibacterium sp.]